MISRRDFIKTFSLAAAGLATGIAAKNSFLSSSESFHLYGFIPSDGVVLNTLAMYIKDVTGSKDLFLKGHYKDIFNKYYNLTSDSKLTINITKSTGNISSDIMRGDCFNRIYSLTSFDNQLFKIRQSFTGTKADLFFSAEQKDSSFLDILSNKKKIIIENHSGVYDEIELNKNFKLVSVPGLQGMTSLEINNGSVKIIKASCRHKLCMKMNEGLSHGVTTACVPNKVLIRTLTT